MKSFDTNIAVYALNASMPEHSKARVFLDSLIQDDQVAICDLMLVELFLKLCNKRIFPQPLSPQAAQKVCIQFRNNQKWRLIEHGDVMGDVWKFPEKQGFAFRRIIDVRLALTLKSHGVTHFATANVKDFKDLGFDRVWNPLIEE